MEGTRSKCCSGSFWLTLVHVATRFRLLAVLNLDRRYLNGLHQGPSAAEELIFDAHDALDLLLRVQLVNLVLDVQILDPLELLGNVPLLLFQLKSRLVFSLLSLLSKLCILELLRDLA